VITTNTLQQSSPPSSSTAPAPNQNDGQPIGLGIGGIWNVHVKNHLRLRKLESPCDPIITKLNVFTVRVPSPTSPTLSTSEDVTTCLICQLWDITNPGEGLKCDDCLSKDFVKPDVLHIFDTRSKSKLSVSRLDTPRESHVKRSSNFRNRTRCSACDLAHAIDPTTSTCQYCISDQDLLTPASPVPAYSVRRSCARRTAKLPPQALQHLRAWLSDNKEHPYPTADTKRALAQECGITEKQVTTWFTNTRARKLAHDRSHASSEDEATYESDFSSMANTPTYASPAIGYIGTSSNHFGSPVPGYAGNEPAQVTLQTSRRGKKKDYRRMNTVSPVEDSAIPKTPATPSPNPDSNGQETWQCTFCYQQLVPKSWRRHEETQHRPKHQWTCLATGPRLTISSRTGSFSMCAFCQLRNPSEDHFQRSHRITECMRKNEADRTFGRPDHLRQHMKNFHKTPLLDLIRDKWRRDGPGKNVNEGWTCGFCKAELKTWDIRETHIANHFKDGLTMATWQEHAQPTPAPAVVDNIRRRPSHDLPASIFSRLQRRLTSRPLRQPEYIASPTTQFSNTFQPIPSQPRCANIAPAPVLPDMDFGTYMPGNLMTEFDFSGVQNFDAAFPMGYDAYQGDGALQMDFSGLVNPELYGDFGGFGGVWGQGQQ
jgi:hypothetical protein